MQSSHSEPDLHRLRKLAEELARSRKERLTSGHLLAAIASHPNPGQELLLDRRLGAETLLKAARASTDDEPNPVARAVERAGNLARHMGTAKPTALHLLLALVSERKSGAHKALAQCGVDVARLRAAALRLALGVVEPRRAAAADQGERPELRTVQCGSNRPSSRGEQQKLFPLGRPARPCAAERPGVAIPLFPPPGPSGHASEDGGAHASSVEVGTYEAHPREALVTSPRGSEPEVRRRPARFSGARPPASALLDPKRHPLLSKLGKNLTATALAGQLDAVVGRASEMERVLDVLAKRRGNCPVLVGAPGVGKTSIVRGIALRATRARGRASRDDRIIIEVPVSELLAGSAVRGSLAERIAGLRVELAQAEGRVVVFFDEIHQLFTGDAEEASSEFKLALAHGEFPCIGATTPEDYHRCIEVDGALARRLSVIEVEEPGREDAVAILEGCTPALGRHHEVEFSGDSIAAAVDWSTRYLGGRALPDKALSALDLAGARARRRALREVDRQAVAEVLAELAHVPVARLLETDRERMLALESILAERVVGHAGALSRMAAILRRNAAGFRGGRPIGTFLLLGPTGVGKTESAKAIAYALFHSGDAMTRLDMAEFAEPHAVARLIGAPPGYVGHDAGGQLTEAVRRKPYQVVLLDEIEKAHRDVLEAFLGVFDEGRLTDGRGRTIDFTNTVILMTSNLGADVINTRTSRSIGFTGRGAETRASEQALVDAARAALPPELYNRIDEVIAFAPLERNEVAEIARRLLAAIGRDLEAARGVALDVDDQAVDALLAEGGFDPELGARPMKRVLARLVEAPLADMILRGELDRGDVARVTTDARHHVLIDVVRRRAGRTRPASARSN